MAEISLRVRPPYSGFMFIGDAIISDTEWSAIEIDGVHARNREAIIAALDGGYIKGNRPTQLLMPELQRELTVRDAESALSGISNGVCCCLASMYMLQPSITSHSDNQVGLDKDFAMTSDIFRTTEAYDGKHDSTSWEIYTDPNYTDLAWSRMEDELNRVYIVVEGLEYDQVYYLRVRYNSGIYKSRWSNTVRVFTATSP